MLANERQDNILKLLRKKGSATVEELAKQLYVSCATVRRDLAQMQGLGLLRRSHGGAVLLEKADEISIIVRMTENAQEKARLAVKAIPHIPTDFKTVFLDSSSTALALAQQMNLAEKTVVTNSLQAVATLSRMRDVNIIVPGGTVSPRGHSIQGSWTSALISEFRFDLMLSSCAALDMQGAYETSIEQRDVKRSVFKRAAFHVLLADHTKFNEKGAYLVEPLSSFDLLVFDELTPAQREQLKNLNVIA